jgi:pimeloyl-ACP methyl ester carboxylesterase
MTEIAFDITGLPPESAPCLIVWAHGWGMTRAAFRPFADTLAGRAAHILVDFPGFGASPVPPAHDKEGGWTTADYADAMADLIKQYRSVKKIIWVGHSFGCRVGIQFAARHFDLVDGLFLVAGAGLPRKRSLLQKANHWSRVYFFKLMKNLTRMVGGDVEALRKKFGSPDYRNAGPMRGIFLNVIRENLSAQAAQIKCPVQLIYGASDTETPPEIGERLHKIIPQSTLTILPDQDHYSLLDSGQHVVVKKLADFMERIK